jgi:hypothetical protein
VLPWLERGRTARSRIAALRQTLHGWTPDSLFTLYAVRLYARSDAARSRTAAVWLLAISGRVWHSRVKEATDLSLTLKKLRWG